MLTIIPFGLHWSLYLFLFLFSFDIEINVNWTGSRKALPCIFHVLNFFSWPDDDPIVGSKLVALYNK
jgi:hypothetical protein